MEKTKKPLYVYLKGTRYNTYKVYREETTDLIEIEHEFDTFDELINYVINFSNSLSIPIQFYM